MHELYLYGCYNKEALKENLKIYMCLLYSYLCYCVVFSVTLNLKSGLSAFETLVLLTSYNIFILVLNQKLPVPMQ